MPHCGYKAVKGGLMPTTAWVRVRELPLPEPLSAIAVRDNEHERIIIGLDEGVDPNDKDDLVDSLTEQMIQTGCARAWRVYVD